MDPKLVCKFPDSSGTVEYKWGAPPPKGNHRFNLETDFGWLETDLSRKSVFNETDLARKSVLDETDLAHTHTKIGW